MDNLKFERVSTTSERLKERMYELGMRQVDLAKASGIDKGNLNKYISGKVEPKDKAVHKLAVALDVNEMWLWGYNARKERSTIINIGHLTKGLTDKLLNDIPSIDLSEYEENKIDAISAEVLEIMKCLSDENKHEILSFARFKLNEQK